MDVNGTVRASDAFTGNVAAWDFTVTLAQGEYVQAFVVNPSFAAGGNTQTEFAGQLGSGTGLVAAAGRWPAGAAAPAPAALRSSRAAVQRPRAGVDACADEGAHGLRVADRAHGVVEHLRLGEAAPQQVQPLLQPPGAVARPSTRSATSAQ